jgi:hypothetical protein
MKSTKTSSPTQPPASKAFRFGDLPGEIRNKIYGILLCNIEAEKPRSRFGQPGIYDVLTTFTKYNLDIETSMLRTCRAVYAEASYVMRKANLFIKVSIDGSFWELSEILIAKRLPILQISDEKAPDFREFVIEHEITPPLGMGGQQEGHICRLELIILQTIGKGAEVGVWKYVIDIIFCCKRS